MSVLSQEQIMTWIKNEQPNEAGKRLLYGGATKDGRVYLKTLTGEVISYSTETNSGKKAKGDL